MLSSIKKLLLDIFFPKFCLGCKKEGSFLCKDCEALLDILRTHKKFSGKNLSDLYWALSYENPLTKKLIHTFKYEPFVKELAKSLSKLILNHFCLIANPPPFKENPNFVLVSVPLSKRRLKWRGFNQAEEIAKELSNFFKIPLVSDCLIKIKETLPQVNLSEKERRKNVEGAFWVRNKRKIRERRILLIDDIFTTGATMEECAKVLKKAGAKEVIGIVIAKG